MRPFIVGRHDQRQPVTVVPDPPIPGVVAYQPWLNGERRVMILAVRSARLPRRYELFRVWIPHSVLAVPRQRPARPSSPALVRLVQGMQPTERKPFATRGCGGSFEIV